MNEEKQEVSLEELGTTAAAETETGVAVAPRRRRRRRRRKKMSKFYRIYFTALAISIVVILVACLYVRVVVGEYERSLPKYTAEKVFEQYFDPIDYGTLLADAQYNAGLASDQAVEEYLTTEIGDEELSWSMGSSTDPDIVRYTVKAGRKQIGSICLEKKGRTFHGFKTYQLARVELALNPTSIPGASVTVAAPANCTVTVDGTVLTEAQRISTYTDAEVVKYYPTGFSGLEYALYDLTWLEAMPQEVVVTDANGDRAEVDFDPVANTYTASPVYSKVLEEQYSEFVTNAVEGYAAYMQQVPGSGFGRIKQYFDANSDLYRAVAAAAADLWMVKTPAGNEFENLYIGEFYPWSDDVFSCHISFTQQLYRGNEWHPDMVDMYVFLRQTGNGYQIYEWYHNS